MAIKKEKALIEVKQRFTCESDNLKHVTEINPLTTTNNHDAADLNKDSHKLVGQSDNLKEVANPSSKCENTPVSNNNSQDEVNRKQVFHVPCDNLHSQCSRQLSDNSNNSANRDDVHHSYLDVGATPCSSNQVSSCAFSNSGVLVNCNSAVCSRILVKEESSPWDISEQLKQDFTHSKNKTEKTRSWHVSMSWVSQERRLRKPCCASTSILCSSRWSRMCLLMMCSGILQRIHVTCEADWTVISWIASAFFLVHREIVASFQACGRVPSSIDRWKMTCSTGAISCAVAFSNFPLSLSGPAALLAFRFSSSFSTPIADTLRILRLGYCLFSCGRFSVSSSVKK